MPSGRFSALPSLSIHVRRTAFGSYRPSCSNRAIRAISSSARALTASVVCPSTPGAPLRAVTVSRANRRFFGAKTLSISVCHCLLLFPFTRAASIGSVQTSRELGESTSFPHWAAPLSPPRVAVSGTGGGVGRPVCSEAVFTFLPPFAPRSLPVSTLLWGLCRLPPSLHDGSDPELSHDT